MAIQEFESPIPDVAPSSEWTDGRLWEDFAVDDLVVSDSGDLREGALTFYSYNQPVVEADIVISREKNGDKVVFIDDIARPASYKHDDFSNPDSHIISAYKTVFAGVNLDKQIRHVQTSASDLQVFEAVLRAGVPEGWRRTLLRNDNEETERWEEAWCWMLDGASMTIDYEKLPNLRGISAGHIALAHSVEIAA